MYYLPDPGNGNKPSVTLTAFAISFVAILGFSIAFAVGRVDKEPGQLMELFWACAALYLGRRVSFNGKTYSGKDEPNESEPNE